MSNTVEVYFMNGHMARLPKEKAILTERMPYKESIPKLLDGGFAVINWNNVCFFREMQELNEEDDD